MIAILTWISIIAGGLLIILLLLSLLGGLDLDIDIDGGSADIDTDASGLGVLKGVLTFVSVSAWVIKVLLATNSHPALAIVIGVLIGLLSFALLSYLIRVLMKNNENVNWSMDDAMFQTGRVYLKIPAGKGEGIVHIGIKGANRELKARSNDDKEIKTGENVRVVDIENEYVIVTKENNL